MNVGGITSNYPMEYGMKKTRNTTPDDCFASRMESVSKGQGFTLHWFDNEEGDKPLGACGLEGGSATVYKPVDFDPENPVYKVRVWDAEGNMTERMVDVSKVDPQKSDFLDMYAYVCHLTDSGEFPDAQSTFMRASANPHGPGSVYDSYLDKMNWVEVVKYTMQVQYDVRNMASYMDYKKFWDFLTK